MSEIKIIAAIDSKRGLAKAGKIPWNLPADRSYFRKHVEDGPVAMGWNTYVSNKYKPYGKGKNIIFTRQREKPDDVAISKDAIRFFSKLKEDIWVAGGGQVYKAALPYATHLYLTRVEGNFQCDVFFPEFEDKFKLAHKEKLKTENNTKYQFEIWERK
ncbi:dihydrofolate reductase [Candidatus Saccharibacteria bacterium]|nr:dihydrofolate reductase [Candidatus Saccharibacteria bacterium]